MNEDSDKVGIRDAWQDVDMVEAVDADTAEVKNCGASDAISTFSANWSMQIYKIRQPLTKGLHVLTQASARNPRFTVLMVTFISVTALVIGLFTNFSVQVDENVLWTPSDAKSVQHNKWIEYESGFPHDHRLFTMFLHKGGADVLGKEALLRSFQAIDAVRNLEPYPSICSTGDSVDLAGEQTCTIAGVSRFFNHSTSILEDQVTTDNDAVVAVSSLFYSDGASVSDAIFGRTTRDENGTLTFCQGYILNIALPANSNSKAFESDALDATLILADAWNNDGSGFHLEVIAGRSFSDEFGRAIVGDIPLVPVVFVIMSIFTCIVFFRRDKVLSRSLLGLGAVVCVLLSIMAGYGLMFICGIAFTSMTQILPFVIFGVGLDDAFIINGAFLRTDPLKTTEDRLRDTFDEVGVSITLTTLTSTLAFSLGCLSSIPAVYWLCLYGFPTLVIDFIYQITFFVALMVLDERRISQNRRDCCVCVTVSRDQRVNDEIVNQNVSDSPASFSVDRAMSWYANHLLRPWPKATVLVAFSALLGAASYSASKLTQEFKFTDVVPKDSYITDFYKALNLYSIQSDISAFLYFRDVDQSNSTIQAQMENYVNDMVGIDAILQQPDYFWLRDFKTFVNATDSVNGSTFSEQLDSFFAVNVYSRLYADDIVRDASGGIAASRTLVRMDNLNQENVRRQIDTLADEENVTNEQPINKINGYLYFFSYDGIYNIWTFYSVTASELILNTVLSITAVTCVSLLFIPHWTAAAFTLPLICILYVDLLGALQWAGIHINAVSYVTLVMSVGLLVDFIMHVIIAYYEAAGNRREKTVHLLQTIGSSVLLAGISTFLGTLPLAFSTSTIFKTIFVAFLALVTLGVGHGLILLPVLLSIFGPEDKVVVTEFSQ